MPEAHSAEKRLELAREMLTVVKEQHALPETIAFWEQAVRDCEAEAAANRPVEKPE